MSFSKDATDLADAVTRIATRDFPLVPIQFDQNRAWLEATLKDGKAIVSSARFLLSVLADAVQALPATEGDPLPLGPSSKRLCRGCGVEIEAPSVANYCCMECAAGR